MVLTPRRWRQVTQESFPRSDGGKRARSPGRARSKRKTIAQGMSGCFGVPVATTLVRFFCCARGCGCIVHPAFPAPSDFRRDIGFVKLGRISVARGRRCGLVVRDARPCRAPHHEGLRPHPGACEASVSRMKPQTVNASPLNRHCGISHAPKTLYGAARLGCGRSCIIFQYQGLDWRKGLWRAA